MKILLDECITKKLKNYIEGFEVFTVVEMGWSGVKNGKLMKLCVENEFDILLTIDKNLMFQQNLDKYPITIAILNSKNSKLSELLPLLLYFIEQSASFEKHKAYIISTFI